MIALLIAVAVAVAVVVVAVDAIVIVLLVALDAGPALDSAKQASRLVLLQQSKRLQKRVRLFLSFFLSSSLPPFLSFAYPILPFSIQEQVPWGKNHSSKRETPRQLMSKGRS